MSNVLVAITLAVGLAACGTLPIPWSPLQAEDRVVSPRSDQARTLVIQEPMVWLDQGPVQPATRGIRIPAGTYVLEAEDGQDLYFRAPSPIEYRTFEHGAPSDDRFMPGGVYLSKTSVALVPGGCYLSVDDTHKTLTWRLGSEFLRLEGSKWTRSG